MAEEREPQAPGGPGEGPDGIEAAARMGADLAAQPHPDDGGPGDGGPTGREALYAEVVGPNNTAHFLARFRKFDARGGAWVFTWSWPCVFFPVLWLLYRKMYAWAAALILVELVLMPTVAASPVLSLVLTTAFVLGVPASANWLYYRHVGKVIARSREAAATDAERTAWRRARGGASWAGPAVVMAVSLLAALWAVSGGTPGG
jgi:hypothetical protein